jgi:hypothetical protein
MAKQSKIRKWIWLGAILCVALVAAGAVFSRRAKVTGDTPEQRAAAVNRLADDKPRGAEDAISDTAVNDSDASVRRIAVVCLSGSQRPEDRPVVEQATHDVDASVRSAAARTLVAYDDDSAVERWIEMFFNDPDAAARDAALEALVLSENPHSTVFLVETMENHRQPEIQAKVANALLEKNKIRLKINQDDELEWRVLKQVIKNSTAVKNDFEQTGTPLYHDPAMVQLIIERHAEYCHSRDLEQNKQSAMSQEDQP